MKLTQNFLFFCPLKNIYSHLHLTFLSFLPSPPHTQKPTLRPSHHPSPRPTLRPTLSPLSVAYITTAVVFDNVDSSTWASEGSTCEQVLKEAIVSSIDVVTQSSQIDSVTVADYSARRRLKLVSSDLLSLTMRRTTTTKPRVSSTSSSTSSSSSFNSDHHHRELSSSLLATFEVVVESDPDLTYVANASMVFKHVTSTFLASINNGSFATAIATQASNKGSSVMSGAAVNVAASQTAVADYSTYYEVVVHRYPTPYPTHSQAPSIHPTRQPAINDAANDDDTSSINNNTAAAG